MELFRQSTITCSPFLYNTYTHPIDYDKWPNIHKFLINITIPMIFVALRISIKIGCMHITRYLNGFSRKKLNFSIWHFLYWKMYGKNCIFRRLFFGALFHSHLATIFILNCYFLLHWIFLPFSWYAYLYPVLVYHRCRRDRIVCMSLRICI